MPTNEPNKQNDTGTHYDYRFLDYRLDQLEHKIGKGLDRLELEQTNNYKEILKTLQLMQDGNNEQNKQLVEISQKQITMEEKLKCIDKLREVATKNTTEIKDIERRIEIYKQILFVVGTGAAIALLTEIITII